MSSVIVSVLFIVTSYLLLVSSTVVDTIITNKAAIPITVQIAWMSLGHITLSSLVLLLLLVCTLLIRRRMHIRSHPLLLIQFVHNSKRGGGDSEE